MSNTWPGGFHEENTAYYAAVGYLCHQWNNVEFFVYSLATDIMHLERKFHSLLFRHLGIKTLQTFLEDYAASFKDEDTLKQIKHVNAFVNVCRLNRNTIVHGLPTSDPETGEPLIRSPADKNRKASKALPISIDAVRRVCMECEQAGLLLVNLQILIGPEADHERLKGLPAFR